MPPLPQAAGDPCGEVCEGTRAGERGRLEGEAARTVGRDVAGEAEREERTPSLASLALPRMDAVRVCACVIGIKGERDGGGGVEACSASHVELSLGIEG